MQAIYWDIFLILGLILASGLHRHVGIRHRLGSEVTVA